MMKKTILPILLSSTLAGCGQSINCDTPEVQQLELQEIPVLHAMFVEEVKIESTSQFTDRNTGTVSCAVNLTYINHENGKREPLVDNPFMFALKVADDNEHFTVTPIKVN